MFPPEIALFAKHYKQNRVKYMKIKDEEDFSLMMKVDLHNSQQRLSNEDP